MSDSQSKASRRGFVLGAAATGAAAAAVVALPRGHQQATPVSAEPQTPPEKGGGYRLSEHVKQYYKTTLI